MTKTTLTLEAPGFSLADTLDCGQAFRWIENGDGSFSGAAGEKFLTVRQEGSLLRLETAPEELSFWRGYFDLDGDYPFCKKLFSADPTLKRACSFAGGITILRQDPWETLCSFILSQNNNIPRIKGIIGRLCETFGKPLGEGVFSFPAPERIAGASLNDLAPLRAGFRAKYVLDAAKKATDGTVDLNKVKALSYPEAKEELMKINGVGPKVADCALLYGFHRLEAFPTDVWIKRVLQKYYPTGFPEAFRAYAGVAQQYLFHSIRCGALDPPEKKEE